MGLGGLEVTTRPLATLRNDREELLLCRLVDVLTERSLTVPEGMTRL
jgi:hypothetical protein